MSELAAYNHELIQDLRLDADASGRFLAESFFERMTARLVDAGELETADWCFYEGTNGQKKLRVDGYGGDPRGAGGILSLIICDFEPGEEVGALRKADLTAIFGRVEAFLRSALDAGFRDRIEETSPGAGLADLIAAAWPETVKVKFVLITNRELRTKVDAMVAGAIAERTVTYNVWDIERFRAFDASGRGREAIFVDFENEFGGGIPVLPASYEGAHYASYLAVIPGDRLAAIYEKWGARLLESNVRSFLQARGKVNKGIRETIRSEPGMFFCFNNGLSATAEDVTVASGPDGLRLVAAANLQIVNGGQTTASIHAASRLKGVSVGDVHVQMKLTVVPPADATGIVPRISEFANSQNKVSAADFFANHPFHIRMEEYSRRLLAPRRDGATRDTRWFYERARGQYQDERARATGADRTRFDLEYPKDQLFTKTDLAKFENSWIGEPHVVSDGAQKNFSAFAKRIGEEWGKHEERFDEIWFRRLIAKGILFRRLEYLVPRQPWYQGGYRANVVTYALAKIAHDAEAARRAVDLDLVWKRQSTSAAMDDALIHAAEAVQGVITSPPPGIRNMSEWAKKQGCWAQVRTLRVAWPTGYLDELITPTAAREAARDAHQEEREGERIAALTQVVNAGPDFWRSVRSWGRDRRALTPREDGILDTCSKIPGRIPSDAQADVALAAYRKLQTLGCELMLAG